MEYLSYGIRFAGEERRVRAAPNAEMPLLKPRKYGKRCFDVELNAWLWTASLRVHYCRMLVASLLSFCSSVTASCIPVAEQDVLLVREGKSMATETLLQNAT